MRWKDLIDKVDLIISKLIRGEENQDPMAESKRSNGFNKISTSGIKIELEASSNDMRKSNSHLNASNPRGEQPYKIRVVRNDPHSENYCFICKGEIVHNRRSRNRKCKGEECTFLTKVPLMEDQEFRNYNDSILIVVDW